MTILRLVLHGKQAHDPAVRAAVGGARTAGHRIEVGVAWEAKDGARLTAHACQVPLEPDGVLQRRGPGTVVTVDTGVTRSVGGSAVPPPSHEWHGRCFRSEPGDAGLATIASGTSRRKYQP